MLYNSFKKKFLTIKGLTLTELLVASVLMGIVMVGVAGYGMNTKSLHSSGGMANILTIRMTAVMKMIEEDAILAIGDHRTFSFAGSAEGSGIRTRETGGGFRKICFRHDVLGTPGDYGDDDWICYCKPNTGALRRFTQNGGNPETGACSGLELITLNQITFYNVVPDHDSPEYVDITIDACYDPTAACDPIDNPQKTMTTRIVPAAHSSG